MMEQNIILDEDVSAILTTYAQKTGQDVNQLVNMAVRAANRMFADLSANHVQMESIPIPDPTRGDTELPLLQQACAYITAAKCALLEIMAFFPGNRFVLPKYFDQAIRLLGNLREQMALLKDLVESEPALLVAVHGHVGEILHLFNVIVEQVERVLIPTLSQRVQPSFQQLQSALERMSQHFAQALM